MLGRFGKMAKKIKATLFISDDKRDKIRHSGLTLEEYFKRLFEIHERFTTDRWTEGCFWIKSFRVCFLRSETLNMLLERFDDDTLLRIGREAGEKLQNSLKYGFDLEPVDDESREKIFEHFGAVSGWGKFILDDWAIIILTPVFTRPFFIQGYLEGALNLELMLVESQPDRMVFNILKHSK